MLIHVDLTFRVSFKKGNGDKKKNGTKKRRIKAYEGFKPWSVSIDINGFKHKLNGPKQIIFY
jgi:hypothetical protein